MKEEAVGGFIQRGSILSKVTATIVAALLLTFLGFGVQVYAFMNKGDRFTKSDASDMKEAIIEEVDDHYTRTEVLNTEFRAIRRQLDRIEEKLDRVEEDL